MPAQPYIDLATAAAHLGLSRREVYQIVADEAQRQALLPSAYQLGSGTWIMKHRDVDKLRERRDTKGLS